MDSPGPPVSSHDGVGDHPRELALAMKVGMKVDWKLRWGMRRQVERVAAWASR